MGAFCGCFHCSRCLSPKHDSSVSYVLKHKEAVMCLMEKICELDKLWSGMNYSADALDFSANEWTIYSKEAVVKQKYKQSKFIYWLDKRKNVWPVVARTQPYISLISNGSPLVYLVFMVALNNIATVNNEIDYSYISFIAFNRKIKCHFKLQHYMNVKVW